MANTMLERVSIITSAVRTLLVTVLLGGLGYGGWYGYTVYNATEIEAKRTSQELASTLEQLSQAEAELETKVAIIKDKEAEIGELNVQVAQQAVEIEQLDTAMRLLKVDHRVARISVVDQRPNGAGDVMTRVEFQEINPNGDPIDTPRSFEIKGDVIYVDSWVVKFDDKYVEQADLHRATSLVLFRRIFGEMQQPRDGFALDEEGARPTVYGRGGELSGFEKKIWGDFWNVANDDSKQLELGIRAVHGEAPSIKVQKGKAYRLDLRASGGLSISTDGDIATPKPPAA